jgi:hypothetical protein
MVLERIPFISLIPNIQNRQIGVTKSVLSGRIDDNFVLGVCGLGLIPPSLQMANRHADCLVVSNSPSDVCDVLPLTERLRGRREFGSSFYRMSERRSHDTLPSPLPRILGNAEVPREVGQNTFKCSLACLNFESLPGTPLPRFGTAENSRQWVRQCIVDVRRLSWGFGMPIGKPIDSADDQMENLIWRDEVI